MSSGIPLYIPICDGENEGTSIWNLPPPPINYADIPPIDSSEINMASLKILLQNVPESQLPLSEPPSIEEKEMSPFLTTMLAKYPFLSTNLSRGTKECQDDYHDSNDEIEINPVKKRSREEEMQSTAIKRIARVNPIIIEIEDDGIGSPSAGDTQESKFKTILMKYEEELLNLINQLASKLDSPQTIKKMMITLELMHKSNKLLIADLPFPLLSDIIATLNDRVCNAHTIDIFSLKYVKNENPEWESLGVDSDKLDEIVCAIDAARCMLYIIVSPNIDRRLVAEDSIDNCVELFKHVLERFLLPSMDTLRLTQLLQEERNSIHTKYHGSLKRRMEKIGLVHIFGSFLETVEDLAISLKLQDFWVLSLSNSLMDLFTLEGTQATQANLTLLQIRASQMLRGIFLHYPVHRMLLLDDIFAVLLKLPTNGRYHRSFKVKFAVGHVQMISMLLVTMAQACSKFSLAIVKETASSIVHLFFQNCMKKEEDHDFRAIFENFVDDLLVMLTSPEWPVVEIFLEVLSGGLINLMSKQKSSKLESQATLVALNLLGKICSLIRQIACDAQKNSIDTIDKPPALVEFREQAISLLGSKSIEVNSSNVVECMMVLYINQQSAHLHVDTAQFYRTRCGFSDEISSFKTNVAINEAIARLILNDLLSRREIFLFFNQILMSIMSYLSKGQPTFRARVLKALGMIVDADPLLMAENNLQKAITQSLSDEAISVRQAAVELVGKYIGLQPTLFPHYYDMLADRLRDKGVSVRKSVLKIFRVYLRLTSIEHDCDGWVSKSLLALVERMGVASEEESIKDSILGTIQDVWFGSHPVQNRRGSSEAVTPASLRKKSTTNFKVLSMIDVVYHANSTEWIVSLLLQLIKKDKGDVNAASTSVISQIMEFLLQLEEGTLLPVLSFQENEIQRVATLKTLHVMCEASPELVVPYLDTMTVYLKQDSQLSKAIQMQVLAIAASMICLVVPFIEKPSEKWLLQLENDLKCLVLGAPPQVVKPAVQCMATLTRSFKRKPTLLLGIIEKLYTFLIKTEPLIQLDKPISDMSNLLRSLFVVGLIAGSLDWNQIPNFTSRIFSQNQIIEMVYCVYSRYAKVPHTHKCFPVSLRVKTAQGLGYLLHRNPRILLRAEEDNTLKLQLLHNEPQVRSQILLSLAELLRAEEARLEKLHETQQEKQGKVQVQGDQEGDASLISGVMQAELDNILKLALQKEPPIRSQAMACINLLLTQGLVAPMKCIPTLVALETDEIPAIRDLAYVHLVGIHGKFPTMVSSPAIQGIYSSYQFQTRAFGKYKVYDSENICYFGRMYRECIQSNRSQRQGFLDGLLNIFREKGPIFTAHAAKRLQSHVVLDYLRYVGEILKSLPYDVEDEPLYIVYRINRDVSLALGSIQDKLKKILKIKNLENIPNDIEFPQELNKTSYLAYGTTILLRIKLDLKSIYLLDNEKCQTFISTNTKMNEIPINHTKDPIRPNYNDMIINEEISKYKWNYFKWLLKQVEIDQIEFDFNWEKIPLKKNKTKKKKI